MVLDLYAFPKSIRVLEDTVRDDQYIELLNCIDETSGNPMVSSLLLQSFCVHSTKGLLDFGQFFHIGKLRTLGFLVCIDDSHRVDKSFFGEALKSALALASLNVKEIRVIVPIGEDEVEMITQLTEEVAVNYELFEGKFNIKLFGIEGFQHSFVIEPIKDANRPVH